MSNNSPGTLFVVSAPSGTGKTTAVRRLLPMMTGLRQSRSYTSRPRRNGERDGVDYNFISAERFGAMAATGEFLEWARVYGHLYGTRAADTSVSLEAGDDVVLVIDVQGGRQVREAVTGVVTVFLLPPSAAVLEQRLRGRNNDDDEVIRQRLAVAQEEVAEHPQYDYIIVNDDLDATVDQLQSIVLAERARAARMLGSTMQIAESFRESH